MEDSILITVRDACGIEEDSSVFDRELIPLINTYLMILCQLGVGTEGFKVVDGSETWGDFESSDRYEAVKTYITTRVRLAFDPPISSHVTNSLTELYKELEWRLAVNKDAEE